MRISDWSSDVCSSDLLSDAAMSFADRAVAGLEPDRERIAALLEQSLMLVTALAPELGYDNAASIAKHAHATGKTLLEAGLELGLVDAETFRRLGRPAEMVRRQPKGLGFRFSFSSFTRPPRCRRFSS